MIFEKTLYSFKITTHMTMRFKSKWLVLAIDLFTIAVSFFLAYFIRFNLTTNFDVSKLVLQLPMIVLIGLTAFLITGSFKSAFWDTVVRDVHNIFKAIGLSIILLILLIAINQIMGVYSEFTIPLSIVLIYGLLSIVGLIGSRYLLKVLYIGFIKKDLR